MPEEEEKRALIVVRTYPVPSAGDIESSCTAAITDKGEWLRLFPVPWRLLPPDQQFRKYQWVDFAVKKAMDDSRRESYRIRPDGIRIASGVLGTEKGWRARKEVVLPMRAHCLCCLARQRDAQQHPTLGIIRPETISRLRIGPDSEEWTEAQLGMLRQQHIFTETPTQELEKIPFKFYYEFRCPESTCKGHTLMCTDWEMGESYRSWKAKYGDQWEGAFRETYESKMISKNDTHFFVGTVASHPNRWIIIGLFYPQREPVVGQASLFEL
jgi:hypothetical protein